jgi:phospholipid/cholesterol/gamma-HCH transport system ATP-binding protein
MQAPAPAEAIIRVRDITVQFGKTRVLDGLDLDVKRGEILGFVGPSGAGKSVLTRTIIGLVPKVSGRIEVFGVDLDAAGTSTRRAVERRWGILFQQGALFSSLTVRQNIQFPVREYLKVSQRLLDEIIGALGRHDQARGARTGARARPGTRVPGRADLGAGPDRRRRFR